MAICSKTFCIGNIINVGAIEYLLFGCKNAVGDDSSGWYGGFILGVGKLAKVDPIANWIFRIRLVLVNSCVDWPCNVAEGICVGD